MHSLRERLLYPKAGWLSLGLLLVMVLALTWSIQNAGWLEQLEFLPPVAFWAILAGAALGVLPLGILVTLPAAAIIGSGVVIWTIGGEYHTALDQGGRLLALREDMLGWTVTVLRTGYPSQMSPYALGLGALVWCTAFTAAYAVYRYNRVIHAILLVGAALVINMSAAITHLGHLLLFVIAALLLWLRAALVERQDGWQRRRVNENLEVPASIMRSGVIFGGVSVLLAWVLTSVAVAAPLTEAWRGFDGLWTSVRDSMEGAFGSLTNPYSRISGDSFGTGFTVQGEWISANDEALTLAASRPLYLRTATYDRYTGRGFDRSDAITRQVAAGDLLFDDQIPERPSEIEAFIPETIAIRMHQTIGRNVFTAGAPLRVYAPVVVHQTGGYPVLGGLDAISPLEEGQGYEVDVAISDASAAQLAAAGTDYPDVVRALYLGTPGLTDRVAQLAADLTAGLETPYDKAAALARYLHSDERFTYHTSAPAPRADQDLVDFFLFDPSSQIGYCQYYASAMVLMARSLGIPARVAVGFAPGERQEDGTYLIRESNAHAWAEVYFPGYGWQIFEPTKTINPQFTRVTGDPAAARPPRLGDPLRNFEFEDVRAQGPTALPSFEPAPGAVDPANPEAAAEETAREGNALVIAVLVLGAAAYIFIRYRRLQRRWRLLPAGDRAWQRLALAADRAGVGPRPSETIYEYAGWLEDQLPRHSEPIRTVADGKVWQAYSGRRMSLLATDRLERAWAKLRLPLLWLALRRWLRGLVRRGPAS